MDDSLPIAIKIAARSVSLDKCTVNPVSYKMKRHKKVANLHFMNRIMEILFGIDNRLVIRSSDKLCKDIEKYDNPVIEIYSLSGYKKNWLFECNTMTYNIREKKL